ncbi:Ribosomal 50S subunit-recycling heat shock protein, contains S4 domain [Aerococcus suis]|uniref:RQC P-site tRNA stabilizing factor n=2 Tax=Aerococcus suis TaxID=371602 RepID=A0A1W1Z3X7_9LACT|nr:Ribosomal 50S subunit-recycling heat shock protein, contains S4 domain [Aerococcus suis]
MSMRLDKFLKVARIIKRRTVAKEVADKGRVEVNGRVAKSGTAVNVGDEIKIAFGNKDFVIRVDEIKDSTKKDEVSEMFTVLEETYKER